MSDVRTQEHKSNKLLVNFKYVGKSISFVEIDLMCYKNNKLFFVFFCYNTKKGCQGMGNSLNIEM